jgi:hypothetical protein
MDAAIKVTGAGGISAIGYSGAAVTMTQDGFYVTGETPITANVSQIGVASGVATITTSANHQFLIDDVVKIENMSTAYNGYQTITAVTANTFSFVTTAPDVATGAATGLVTGNNHAITRGPSLIEFPTNGNPNIISGDLQANTLTVVGNPEGVAASLRANSALEPNSTLVLNNIIAKPSASPSVQVEVPITYANTSMGFSRALSDNGIIYSIESTSPSNSYYIKSTSLGGSKLQYYYFQDGFMYNATTSTFTSVSMTAVGTSMFILGLNTSGQYMLYKYTISGSYLLYNNVINTGQTNSVMASIGVDYTGSNILFAYIGTSSGTLKIRKYTTATLMLSGSELTTTWRPSGVSQTLGISQINSIIQGDFDYGAGAARYVLSYRYTDTNYILVFTSAGALSTNDGWSPWSQKEAVYWRASTGNFYGINDGAIYTYSKNIWTTENATWWFAYTFSSGGNQTALSPKTSVSMSKRRTVTVTTANSPTNEIKVYVGRNSSAPADSAMYLQSTTLTNTQPFITLSPATFTGTTAASIVQFTGTTPARLYSQQTDSYTINVNTTSGSTTITTNAGTGGRYFHKFLVGASISGSGIPAGATIVSVNANGYQLTMSAAATGSFTNVPMSIIQNSIDIRGDGYTRVGQFIGNKTILTSNTDASLSAGNEPALRVGDINGLHLRIDGNEIICMASDDGTTATQGALLLNMGGQVRFGIKTWQTGTVSITPSAANTTTTADIVFPTAFNGSPIIMLTQLTGAGSTVTSNVWTTGASATGFTMNLNRSNTTTTTTRWLAIDM